MKIKALLRKVGDLGAIGELVEIEQDVYDADPLMFQRIEIVDVEDEDAAALLRKENTEGLAEAKRELTDAIKSIAKGVTDAIPAPAPGRIVADSGERYGENAVEYGQAMRANPGWERQWKRETTDEEKSVMSAEAVYHCRDYLLAALKLDGAACERIYLEQTDRDIKSGLRAGHTTTTTAGGFLMPAPLSDFISIKRDKAESIGPRCAQFTSDSKTLDIPQENAIGAVAKHTEQAAISATDSTFTEVVLTKKKYGRLATITWELIQDQSNAFSIINLLSNQIGRKLGVLFDLEAATGATFSGDIHDATVTSAATGSVTLAMIILQYYGLPYQYRQGTAGLYWMGTDALAGILASNLEDTVGNNVFKMGSPAGTLSDDGTASSASMLGIPWLTVPFADAKLVLGRLDEGFGILRDPAGLRVDLSTEAYFTTDQVGLRVLERRDGDIILNEAFIISTGALTA